MIYRIYPPIGIARLGNSLTEFFIASESPDSNGTELKDGGSETEVTQYKTGDTGNPDTSFQVKRQAARFRIYEFENENSPGKPAVLPANSVIEWGVHLINKKDAVERPEAPPPTPIPIQVVSGREDRIIDAGLQSIRSDAPQTVSLSGKYLNHPVFLGELRLDPSGNLLVLGGLGKSETFEGVELKNDFYNNPGWHDDVSDGPVTARIVQQDGSVINVQGAWVVVAPPDFAPAIKGIVTLYDRILQFALQASPPLVTIPATPSFTRDILPLIRRTRALRWVHDNTVWGGISTDEAKLADPSPAGATRRRNTVRAIMTVDTAFHHPDYDFKFCEWQLTYLTKYNNGGSDFISDHGTATPIDPMSPEALTKTVLDGTVGEGLFPGIEAGMILGNMSLYTRPFTFHLDHGQVQPGDLTALMALPWQADFNECDTGWWPTQRPNKIPGPAPRKEWDRGVVTKQDMVDRVMRLGVITETTITGEQEVFEEKDRDPSLPTVP